MKKQVIPDLIGAKIVSISHQSTLGDKVNCTEVVIEKDGVRYSIFPHIADNPELVGPIDLTIIPRLFQEVNNQWFQKLK